MTTKPNKPVRLGFFSATTAIIIYVVMFLWVLEWIATFMKWLQS